MTTIDMQAPSTTRPMVIAGWVLSGLLIAFMTFDTVIKLLDLQVVIDTMNQLGIPPSLDRTIGAIELVCLVLYAIPRTSVLGAILFTAIFGLWFFESHSGVGSIVDSRRLSIRLQQLTAESADEGLRLQARLTASREMSSA